MPACCGKTASSSTLAASRATSRTCIASSRSGASCSSANRQPGVPPRMRTGEPAASEIAAPLGAGERRRGLVNAFPPTVRRFTPDDAELLTSLAAAAAVALTNARLYGEAQDGIDARDEFLSTAAHDLNTP